MIDFDEDYMNAEGPAFVQFNDTRGEFKFGYIEAQIFITQIDFSDSIRTISFEFEGMDELDQVHGASRLKFTTKTNMEGVFEFYQSDSYKFFATKDEI